MERWGPRSKWLKNRNCLAQMCWVMTLGSFHSSTLWCEKHAVLNGGYVPKPVKGRMLGNKSRSSRANMFLCSSGLRVPTESLRKTFFIFTALAELMGSDSEVWAGEFGSGLTVYILLSSYSLSGVGRCNLSITHWSFPSWNLMQTLLSPKAE